VCGGETHTECHKHGACDRLERTANRRAPENVPNSRNHDRVHGEPYESHRRERRGKSDQSREGFRELREQTREEDADLRVSEVAQEALPEGAQWPSRGVGLDRPAAQNIPKRMKTQVNEIRGADPFQGDEERFRRKQDGREPGARGSTPDRSVGKSATWFSTERRSSQAPAMTILKTLSSRTEPSACAIGSSVAPTWTRPSRTEAAQSAASVVNLPSPALQKPLRLVDR
jgi:hypothetical protein